MKAKSEWIKAKNTAPDPEEQGRRSFGYDSESDDKPSTIKNKNRLDPLTASLGEIGFYHRMRWTWFAVNINGVRYPLEVSRYYEKNNLAIDLMPNKQELDDCALKADLCKKYGVRYYILNDMNDANRMLKELGRTH